jgi:ATP-binding cassette subfamily A (ABC1) protein 1
MDPVARRFMWEVISDIVTKREQCSLILTTHSMEECEALCTRIGIMVGGVLRCLGSGQRLRNRYGTGLQIEIGLRIPDTTEIDTKLFNMLDIQAGGNRKMDTTAISHMISEPTFKLDDILKIFTALSRDAWSERIHKEGTGAELLQALDSTGYVLGKQLASWIILEDAYDNLVDFMTKSFYGFKVTERQTSRVRCEISSVLSNGTAQKLSIIFGLMEGNKVVLRIQEYSVSQISLEQIFNQFASQQREETGKSGGFS